MSDVGQKSGVDFWL